MIGERVKELSGKVAFVTGSAGGIGLGIARAFAEAGMKIVLSDIDGPALEQSAAELAKETSAEVIAVPLDVTDRGGWARVAREVPAALGPVQLLVNNAGVSTLGMRFDEIGPELWDRVISINLTGVYNGVHYFLDGMRAAGGGHIVNTSSMGGLIGFPTLSPYSASKFAVVGLSEALSGELAESGIGVSVLTPGRVRSRLWRTSRAVRGLPDTDIPPSDASGQSAGPGGMDPDEVGRRVVDAVVANELYIITHPEMREFITQRHQRVMHGFDRAEAFGSKAGRLRLVYPASLTLADWLPAAADGYCGGPCLASRHGRLPPVTRCRSALPLWTGTGPTWSLTRWRACSSASAPWSPSGRLVSPAFRSARMRSGGWNNARKSPRSRRCAMSSKARPAINGGCE